MSAAKPRTVRGWAVLFGNGQLLADNDGEGDHPDEYRCLIVPDVRCGHDTHDYPTNHLWCPECGCRFDMDRKRWIKPRILRVGRK